MKTKNAVDAGLSVIACIGEQLADRQNGTTMVVCAEQLEAIKAALKEADWKKVVIGERIDYLLKMLKLLFLTLSITFFCSLRAGMGYRNRSHCHPSSSPRNSCQHPRMVGQEHFYHRCTGDPHPVRWLCHSRQLQRPVLAAGHQRLPCRRRLFGRRICQHYQLHPPRTEVNQNIYL